jgi:hypothetical protein
MPSLLKPEFRFDPEKHEYWLGSKKIPGVSDILKTVGLSKDFTNVDPFYRERGIQGHKCIELFLKDDLDESSIDPILTPFFDGFKRYWDKFGTKPRAIELALYNENFAGTIDLVTNAIVDWKFSKSHDKVAELQGEAYKILAIEPMPFQVVQFPGDGSFEVYDYGDGIDNWPHVMSLYRWKKGLDK